MKRFIIHVFTAILAVVWVAPLSAQTDTAFTYQGRLDQAGQPFNGQVELVFDLYNADVGGISIGNQSLNGVAVIDGLFTVELNSNDEFGPSAFVGEQRWLKISVNGTALSPRQALTAAPNALFALNASSLNLPYAGSVDVSSPGEALKVTNTGSGGALSGRSDNTAGRGVFGWATAGTGFTLGVYGLNDSEDGLGVLGTASALSGNTFGVYGQSNSDSGTGVYGIAAAEDGENYGVYGEAFGMFGTGVYGRSNNNFGQTFGVKGESASSIGTGVHGISTSINGDSYGVCGENSSSSGIGVYGVNRSLSGNTQGVWGETFSTNGTGVFGRANTNTGVNTGVYGISTSSSGRGIQGVAGNPTGATIGVYGLNNSTSGIGILGTANANSGTNFGVYGVCNNPAGYDFYAGGAGINYGASSSRRWKNNVVPINDPLDKLALLRGVYFDWDQKHGGMHDVGMIAEEVGVVLPEIVAFEENGIDAHGMDYSKLTPLLVEAVNALRAEQAARIESLRAEKDAEIAALRSKAKELTADNNRLATRLEALEQAVQRMASN